MTRLLLCLALTLGSLPAADPPPVYHLIWFDTEDYIEPTADDAALRLADELTRRGVRATFKIVGEKARVLEQRGRVDVLRALAKHDIGYHSENHSIPPSPAVYLEKLGLLEGAAEFARREEPGLRDLQRIFGVTPSCYGQPGNSWGPQSNLALRRWGVPVYMDEGNQIGYRNQPFWYGGLLYVFNLGRYSFRADINDPAKLKDALRAFDANVAELRKMGGGVMQTYYHPTEFVTTEFWDGVNFRHGAGPERSEWKLPQKRTRESSEQAYRLFLEFVDYARAAPGVHMITARDIRQIMAPRESAPSRETARGLAASIAPNGGYSASELLLRLLEVSPRYVDGPSRRGVSTFSGTEIPRPRFDRAKASAVAFIEKESRLPDHVWLGSERLSLADFAATLAGDSGGPGPVSLRKGKLDLEQFVTTDAAKAYNWVIHPKGFAPEELLEIARLQAWTLKAAQLR